MKKIGLTLLANEFEDSEAIVVIDILKRAGLGVDVVSVMSSLGVTSQYQLKLQLDKCLADVTLSEYDFLFIPGGKAVSTILFKRDDIKDVILEFEKDQRLIATICAAPSLLCSLGLFNGHDYTCFPGYENKVGSPQGHHKDCGVVQSGHYITGKSMAYSIEFALEMVKYLLGNDEMKKVEKAIYGQK